MKEILIFAGTTEGRRLSEVLAASGIANTLCVATGYGETVLTPHPLVKVHSGRMDREEIERYIGAGEYAAVVDATHPYAEAVTENIRAAVEGSGIPCLRLKRETAVPDGYKRAVRFENHEACAKALEGTEGNILLTVGSKELAAYCGSDAMKERLYVRVLPSAESLALCAEQGIAGKRILALQGPFSAGMNEAMIRQYGIRYLVTKASGAAGGFPEKLKAAENAGIPVFVVGREKPDPGYSFGGICRKLEELCGFTLAWESRLEVVLAGAGMGSRDNMTEEVREAAESADLLFGAERLIAGYRPRLGKMPFYKPEEVIPCLKRILKDDLPSGEGKAVVLFSGDSGFFSGCRNLYRALLEETKKGGLNASVRILPGISSVAYLAACTGESYQDAAVYSMHGKEAPDLADKIKRAEKTFLLTSGARDLKRLGRVLLDAGLDGCEVVAGYRLSYPDQRIMTLTPEECCGAMEEGLYTCLVRNPHAEGRRLTHGRADAEFEREKIPMTKEEVREAGICKLHLHDGAVVYDIGSGTGSVAVEIAGLSERIRVFAIDHRKEAAELTGRNREKFRLVNLDIVSGEAPECFEGLPVPTHAFIGGSGGKLEEILAALYRMNPRMRVVMTAVSLETVCEIRKILSGCPVEREELVQMQVSRAVRAGAHHLMRAENPVWICAFDFRKADSDET